MNSVKVAMSRTVARLLHDLVAANVHLSFGKIGTLCLRPELLFMNGCDCLNSECHAIFEVSYRDIMTDVFEALNFSCLLSD